MTSHTTTPRDRFKLWMTERHEAAEEADDIGLLPNQDDIAAWWEVELSSSATKIREEERKKIAEKIHDATIKRLKLIEHLNVPLEYIDVAKGGASVLADDIRRLLPSEGESKEN